MTFEALQTGPVYPIRDAFRKFFTAYKATHDLSPSQEKAGFSISSCKTGDLGYNVSYCPECGRTFIHASSCNNRNCPCCQYPQEQKWIAQRESEIIPGIAYYHVVFTVPSELNPLIMANQEELYNLMFRAAADTLLTLCADKRWLGAKPGIIALLHTWGQKLNDHPHIHTIVTGGGLTPSGKFVEGRHKGYLIPAKVIAPVFRGKYLEGLRSFWDKGKLCFPESLSHLRNSYEWKNYLDLLYGKKWFPFLKETFNGKGNAVKYLARYAYRTAISNSRVDFVDDDSVTFHYRDYSDGSRQKSMTMEGEEFVGAFLSHVLPSGFHRVRFYGFLANCMKQKNLELIYRLLNKAYAGSPVKGMHVRELFLYLFHKDICECPYCKGTVVHMARGVPLQAIN
ncbi:MAG: IS91 family transposase [Clostridiales bacterium]|nr:IS91 family transposase [Clostridiales bacterium]